MGRSQGKEQPTHYATPEPARYKARKGSYSVVDGRLIGRSAGLKAGATLGVVGKCRVQEKAGVMEVALVVQPEMEAKTAAGENRRVAVVEAGAMVGSDGKIRKATWGSKGLAGYW